MWWLQHIILVKILQKCHILAKCMSVYTFNMLEGLKIMTEMLNLLYNYHVECCDTFVCVKIKKSYSCKMYECEHF